MKKTTKKINKDKMIEKILAHVNEMVEYAKDNMCMEDCYIEELEWMLYKLAK